MESLGAWRNPLREISAVMVCTLIVFVSGQTFVIVRESSRSFALGPNTFFPLAAVKPVWNRVVIKFENTVFTFHGRVCSVASKVIYSSTPLLTPRLQAKNLGLAGRLSCGLYNIKGKHPLPKQKRWLSV
jgi:hypothetical protein